MTRRGRPPGSKKPLSLDPDRYFLVFAQVCVDVARLTGRVSEIRVAEQLACWRHGTAIPTTENLAAAARGEKYRVFSPIRRGNEGEKDWRNKNTFRPLADDLRRKLRRLRKISLSDPDGRWLAAMRLAWGICLLDGPEPKDGVEAQARSLAVLAGEAEYFENVLQPILRGEKPKRQIFER